MNRRIFLAALAALVPLTSLADGSGGQPPAAEVRLRLSVDTTGEHVVLVIALANEGKRRLCLNHRLSVDQESCCRPRGPEISLRVMDQRSRTVNTGCSRKSLETTADDFGVLEPGEVVTGRYHLGECFDFEKGETIKVHAYYRDMTSQPPPPPSGVVKFSERVDAAPLTFKVP